MSSISLKSVRKHFGRTPVIHEMELEIADGEFVVCVGPSGCGKSTLLRLIAGLEDVSGGDIAFDGEDVTELEPAQRGVAMVFQSYALYPHMTVFDNLAFGLKLAKADKAAAAARVREAARVLQIEPLLGRKPRELSGGQRQRVAIGRAIVRQPRVFLFDEPLSNLDAALRVQMRLELQKLHRELGTTMIYVTHDQVEAMTLADRIVVLNNGRIEQVGTPLELYRQPRNRFVAGFLGSPAMNFLTGTVTSSDGGRVTVALGTGQTVTVPADAALESGMPVTLGIRPEHVRLAGESALRGEVIGTEHLGADIFVYVDSGGEQPLVVKAGGSETVAVGQTVPLELPPGHCLLFDESGDAVHPAADR